jgi:hypothetical protein
MPSGPERAFSIGIYDNVHKKPRWDIAYQMFDFLFRRRIHLQEMEKGPNKILLNSDDLVFFVPKSKSASTKVSYK